MDAQLKSKDEMNIGILALEVYFPASYITQTSLEEHYGVSPGKYTLGLGQIGLSVLSGDVEDINSICLTVVHSLLEKYDIDPNDVGRLEVGTETLIDKSKSTKTLLMQLFPNNPDIEGATVVNACYGGTAALLNAFAWVESSAWDGRYAIVVSADIAAYAPGPARPTSGCGAVAILVGRDAPLSFSDPRKRVTYACHTYDFYKPDHNVEYPIVDGALSQVCYYRALEDCYARFCSKMESLGGGESTSHETYDAVKPDYFVFHSPYNKLVQKSYARLFLIDARRKYQKILKRQRQQEEDEGAASENENKKEDDERLAAESEFLKASPLGKWLEGCETDWEQSTFSDRELDTLLKDISFSSYKDRLMDANHASTVVGNTYTASVFFGLASLVSRAGSKGKFEDGSTICIFSYGSGALASMYMLTVRTPSTHEKFTIKNIARTLDLEQRLNTRDCVDPSELDFALEVREKLHAVSVEALPYTPLYPVRGYMLPGTYYLKEIDNKWRRFYERIPLDDTSRSQRLARSQSSWRSEIACLKCAISVESQLLDSHETTESFSQGSQMPYVITGISAGLPGLHRKVFSESNLESLVRGEQCIEPVSIEMKQSMVAKNVIQLKKLENGAVERVPINNSDKVIQLAAQLSSVQLSCRYGVPKGLEETMDVAAQVALAAGLEAMKAARLLSGKSSDPSEWKLKEEYQHDTGVVYASSFPAMDAAVGEVMRFLHSTSVEQTTTLSLLKTLRSRVTISDTPLSAEDAEAFRRLEEMIILLESGAENFAKNKQYEFDRKFLFRVLVLGNAQLAQFTGCKGPNTQTNAACAGTTQAIAMAQDMITAGRAKRVVVIAGDNGSGETLLPWLGSGFTALGAATTAFAVEDAALPFDKRRSGMLLGAGGIGIVLETSASAKMRSLSEHSVQVKAQLLATQYSNSAFHGAALDRKHIASELERFLVHVHKRYGITKEELVEHGVYFSHETSTHATSASSCAGNEVAALRKVFGEELLCKLLILNTKGFTGHPMGVSFEDVAAVQVLVSQTVPPIVNHKVKDEYLGDLNLSKGGPYKCKYALRFAAGFGSQVAFALYAVASLSFEV